MTNETEPRPEFVGPLRDWFVDELRGPVDTDRQLRRDPPVVGDPPPADITRADARPPRRRRWMLLVNAAAVLAVVVGLALVRSSDDDPGSEGVGEEVRTTVRTAATVDPVASVVETCERYRAGADAGAETLPLGAAPKEVLAAAADVRSRLAAARLELAAIDSSTAIDLHESLRLVDEAIGAADRLNEVAGSDRQAIDVSVENIDLIVAALGRELAKIAGGACEGLPTLREEVLFDEV